MRPSVTPSAVSADLTAGYLAVQGFREGSVSFVDFKTRMAAAGRVFRAQQGSVVTALTFADYSINLPQGHIRVPAGTTAILTKFSLQLMTLTGTAAMVYLSMCSNDIGNGTSSAASIGPVSTRSDAPVASLVTARQLTTVAATAMTTPIDLDRWALPFATTTNADVNTKLTYEPNDAKAFLIGPASAVWTMKFTTAATGFSQFEWIETPSSWWT